MNIWDKYFSINFFICKLDIEYIFFFIFVKFCLDLIIVGIVMISICIVNWYVVIWDNNKRCIYLIWVCVMYMVVVWMFYIGGFLLVVAFFVLNIGNDFLVGLSSIDSCWYRGIG